MSNIKDFLKQKISNFKKFIDVQLDVLKTKGVEISESKIINFKQDLKSFEDDINRFAQNVSYLEGREIDESVKIFLLKYDIDVNIIIPHIDYEKLKKYIECFIEVLKN